MTARVVAVEFAQGFGAMLRGAVVNRYGATLSDRGHKASRGGVGLEGESKREWQGTMRMTVLALLGAHVWARRRALSRVLLRVWRLILATRAGLRRRL